jgi:hypothetical protein
MARALALSLLLLPLSVFAQTSSLLEGAKSGLSGSLAGSMEDVLDITEDQAEGGIGSVLTLAQENLPAGDFGRLTGMIPGADGYLSAAKSLGAVTGPLKSLSGLNESLARLGMSPETVNRFVPTLSELLSKVGGEEARHLLETALRGG